MSVDCAWVTFQRLMFKSGCLVFQDQWLESLCLVSAPARPLVFIPVKEGVVPCAAYLSRSGGILRPFYFDDAGGWRWTVTVHWQLTHPPLARCLSTALSGKYYLHSWKKRRTSLHPFTCFVFQVEYCGTKPKAICWQFWAFHYSTLSSLTLTVGKYYCFFSLLWTWREVVCILIVYGAYCLVGIKFGRAQWAIVLSPWRWAILPRVGIHWSTTKTLRVTWTG